MTLRISSIALALAVCVCAWLTPAAGSPNGPHWASPLRQMGYDTTEEGLAEALQDRRAVSVALRFIAETGEPMFLDEAARILANPDISIDAGRTVQIHSAAANLLAMHGREEGLAWIRQWERLSDDELALLPGSATAHAILNGAAVLAERNDDRLARHVHTLLRRHHAWGIKAMAVRSLGSFSDLSNEHVHQAWIDAAEIARRALTVDPPEPETYASFGMFLQQAFASAWQLTNRGVKPTPEMLDAFEALAELRIELPNAVRVSHIEGSPDMAATPPLITNYNEQFRRRTAAILETWLSAFLTPDPDR